MIVPLLAVLVGLVPAATSARADGVPGKLVDRTQSGTASACRLVVGSSADVCVLPTGDDVSPEAIAAYQATWTHRALTLQRALGDAAPLGNSDWVSTHNSFNSASYPPTLSGLDPNQQLTLSGQLDVDVRNLELDLHWFPSVSDGLSMAPVVCHGQGPIGCTIEPDLRTRLLEIRQWLDAHPGDVILLYLEDQLDASAGYDAAAATINDVLGDLVWRPPAGGGCQPMPLSVARAAIRAAGAQVLIRSSCDGPAVTPAWTDLVFGDQGEIEYSNDGTFRPYPECDPTWDRATLDANYARHYEDSTFLSTAVAAAGGEQGPAPLDPATVHAMVQCGIDDVGMDEVVPNDPRLAAYVWSWAPDEPAVTGPGFCARTNADGRFAAAPCSTRLPVACLDPTGAWTVSAVAAMQYRGQQACDRTIRGSVFAVPHTGYAAARLHDAMVAAGVEGVWLNYAVDAAGVWRG